jgi:hypothetical protein
MKPTGNTHRRSTLNSLQHPPKVKNAVLHRISNVTRELEAIQAEMHSELTGSATDNRVARFFEDASATQVINDFKAEIDQLRRILWFYTEDAAKKPEARVDPEQQTLQLQRFTELLRALAPKASTPELKETKPSVSFFERLEVVMDTYMKDKKPVGQITTIKSSRH